MESLSSANSGKAGDMFRAWGEVIAARDARQALDRYMECTQPELEVLELRQAFDKTLMLMSIHSARMSGAQVVKEGKLWYIAAPIPF